MRPSEKGLRTMSLSSEAVCKALTVSDDKFSLLLKKGSKVPSSLTKLKHAELSAALASLKVKQPANKASIQVIREAARLGVYNGADFEVCQGTQPQCAEPGRWEWVESLRRPPDHAVQGEVVFRIIPPAPPRAGIDIFGNTIAAKEEPTPEPLSFTLPPELELKEDGSVLARSSGQVKIDGVAASFEPVYVIETAHAPEYSVCEFHCDIHVLGDLIGNMKWRVFGRLEVEGHWQAPDIEVFGDVLAKGGIQTNMIGTLRFWHNCQTTYIQVSRVGVLGSLVVENSIQLSEVRVGGDLTCTSNPGVILGSTLHVYGGVRANKVGSENGQKTRLSLLGGEQAKTSRIERLLQGTMITYNGEMYCAATDTSFDSSEPPTAVVGGSDTGSSIDSDSVDDTATSGDKSLG